ncbi:MAG: AlpA family phage regulatory protein [Deltaproteobacteria bacterium]|nr:AlpA family phage regulatory protein [Deltaproteobacteria bacterium]
MEYDCIVREKKLLAMLGGPGRTTIWRWEKAGLFPRRRKLSTRSVGWLLSEIQEWMATRPQVNGVEALRGAVEGQGRRENNPQA